MVSKGFVRFGIGLIVMVLVGSCSVSRSARHAASAYDIGEYHRAVTGYKKVYKKAERRSQKAEALFKIAESYRYIGDYRRAESYYKNAIRRNYPDPIAILHYADVLRANQEFEEAQLQYRAYLEVIPNDVHALNGLESCTRAPQWIENPTRYTIEPLKTLNSKSSDYSAVYPGGRSNAIVFTSAREGATGKKTSPITGELYTDLFIAHYDKQKGRWGKPTLLDESLTLNTEDEEGAGAFDAKGTTLYFTRCRYDKGQAMGAEVYSSASSGDAWSEPIRVELAGDSLLAAHPSLSADGKTLYFVSDKPGGYGGKDIWMVEGGVGNWGKPKNLGPTINTPGDEMFPFSRDNGAFYFSSDYHVGMGGLDIFKAHKDMAGQWQIENMKTPINSPGDDFAIYFVPGEDVGLFSSRRAKTRLDDIFSFVLPPKIYELEGRVMEKDKNARLRDVTVRLIGTDGTMLRLNAANGKFKFKLNEGTEYVVVAFKKGYLNAKQKLSTVGLTDSQYFAADLALVATDEPIRIDNIYFEFGKWDLLPESTASLDSLVELLNQNPTITIELMAHTDCVGDDKFNSDLSQRRAQSVVRYLNGRGIALARMSAKGYGETAPRTVTREMAKAHDFLRVGDELTCDFIAKLVNEAQIEICHQINRRTEFRVLSTDYREQFDENGVE